MATPETLSKTTCYHCGEDCLEETVRFQDKVFCCTGCKLVYEILSEHQLCTYYAIEQQPGNTRPSGFFGDRFSFLDNEAISQKLIRYREGAMRHVCFHIVGMHCSSCIWLLEHLTRLDPGIVRSQTDFIRKELTIIFDAEKTSLRQVVEILHRIGYPPELNMQQTEGSLTGKKDKSRIYKIGVAGFAFGNIMLLSFPAYFSGGVYHGGDFKEIFGYLNLLLALPVFFFSAGEFLQNALLGFRQKIMNIDVPIALGITAMFMRSTYEIVTASGSGYFDSMTGLVFFMLLGRNFQHKTYDWLAFNRDYKSYFPIAVTRIRGTQQEAIPVQDIRINDRLLIRNQEVIPADVVLMSDAATIDYSFVTGESRPIQASKNDRLFAGGRLTGAPAEVLVQQEVSHSYLTRLWNQSSGKDNFISGFRKLTAIISKWFVTVTLLIAMAACIYWSLQGDSHRALHALTSVLVIACACALALSAPFTFGNMLRILGSNGIYLKNAEVLEKLSDIDTVLFDKTGTLTEAESTTIDWDGINLSDELKTALAELANASSHPLSRMLVKHLGQHGPNRNINGIKEVAGGGISCRYNNQLLQIGSPSYLGDKRTLSADHRQTKVGVRLGEEILGYFCFRNKYRSSATAVVRRLKSARYELAVSSGDHDHERPQLESMLSQKHGLRFEQKPADKLDYVTDLQRAGRKVMMVGDGLNDAGALLHSHVGLAVSEDINNFTPGCDGILLARRFGDIPALLAFAKAGHKIILISFIISLLYNAVGLWYAVQGTLSPVIAAILMPISTSSLVVYTVVASNVQARRLNLKH